MPAQLPSEPGTNECGKPTHGMFRKPKAEENPPDFGGAVWPCLTLTLTSGAHSCALDIRSFSSAPSKLESPQTATWHDMLLVLLAVGCHVDSLRRWRTPLRFASSIRVGSSSLRSEAFRLSRDLWKLLASKKAPTGRKRAWKLSCTLASLVCWGSHRIIECRSVLIASWSSVKTELQSLIQNAQICPWTEEPAKDC